MFPVLGPDRDTQLLLPPRTPKIHIGYHEAGQRRILHFMDPNLRRQIAAASAQSV